MASLFVFVFSIFEKINKERFVLNYTNQKTRTFFLEMINQSCLASVVVSVNGDIQFYNEPFQVLINQRLHVRKVPPSIYALTE